jgi:hypothetical protein
MSGLLPLESIRVGGWFGADGESEPTNEVFTDGWFGGSETLEEVSNRLARLEQLLRLNRPIFINNNGRYEELVV